MCELDERESFRFYASHQIEYHPIVYQELSDSSSENGKQETAMLSIGDGGVEFTAKSPLSVSSVCAFWIKIPDFQLPVLALGEVVWQKEIDDTYHIGAQWAYWQDNEAKRLTLQFCRKEPRLRAYLERKKNC